MATVSFIPSGSGAKKALFCGFVYTKPLQIAIFISVTKCFVSICIRHRMFSSPKVFGTICPMSPHVLVTICLSPNVCVTKWMSPNVRDPIYVTIMRLYEIICKNVNITDICLYIDTVSVLCIQVSDLCFSRYCTKIFMTWQIPTLLHLKNIVYRAFHTKHPPPTGIFGPHKINRGGGCL